MSNHNATTEERTEPSNITRHVARDSLGEPYMYYECEVCGVETTDSSILSGCFRCGAKGEESR